MPGFNIVDTMQEEIYQKLRGHLPPPAVEVIIRLHDQQRTLERGMTDLQDMMAKLVEAMKLNQALYQNMKGMLKKIENKYDDPYKEVVQSTEASDET